MKTTSGVIKQLLAAGAVLSAITPAFADANPKVPFYGYGAIVANPAYPIVGESTEITVTVSNDGDAPASNVQVKISFNDWGVTFQGWQEIATVTVPSIPPGGTATAQASFVFENSAHTCVEAVIVGASANSNPDDDRGQINLEVINAGETFNYWVPVVNNGDAPLNLQLVGCRKFRPGTPNADGNCEKVIDEAVEVLPGETLLVPVHLDLANVPVGQEVIFVLDAYDGGPNDTQNRNHVELRIRRQTARGLKQNAAAQLAVIGQAVANKNWRKQIEAVGRHVEEALKANRWVPGDDNAIHPNGGATVFAQEQAALRKIDQLLGSDIPVALKAALNQVALSLADADRILAEAANDGGGAQSTINEGDVERASGDYVSAVSKYWDAWRASQ